jgi:hypothetical protein
MSHEKTSSFLPDRRTFLKVAGSGAGAAVLLPRTAALAAETGYPNLAQARARHEAAGIISPQKTYRMMEWEAHTPPEEHFNINLEAATQAARDSGAESMMFYSQDHWGYAYYQSDVAVRHPNLDRDIFGTEVSLANKLKMSVVCYYSLQFNNQIVLSHPDWGWVDENGKQQRMRWYITCLDSPYRQYVLGMMNEIFSRYEVAELFLDIYGIQFAHFHGSGVSPFCFCKYTEEAWNRDHPGDPYREGFNNPEGWELRYRWHQKRTMTDMLDEIIAAARSHRPNVIISLNGGPESFPDDIMQKVSFIYAEPITTTTGISIGSILMRGYGRPDYQAGVFSKQGYLDLYPGSIPRVKANALMVQNARTFIVGNAPIISDLDGQGFSKRWFAVAKETWSDVRNVDSLLEGVRPVLSTAMLYSVSTRDALDAEKRPMDFRRSTVGALETLTYAGRPVESLAEFRLTPEELAKFEALVLPEVEVLSDAQADVIRNWVKAGGTLVASYKCGLRDEKRQARSNFALADVFGVDFESDERKYIHKGVENPPRPGEYTSTYLESAGSPLAKTLAMSTVGLAGSFLRLKKTSGEEVMRYRLPFMVEDMEHNHWFNWGPPPPGTETGGTAVAHNRFGKGQSLYIGVPIFWAMQWRPFWIRQWIPELMRQLVKEPIAELRPEPFTEYLHGTFFYDKSGEYVLVQMLNTVEAAMEGEYREIPRVRIGVDGKRLKVTGARMVWPKEQDLEVHSRGGRTEIVLQNPPQYAAVYLKLGEPVKS